MINYDKILLQIKREAARTPEFDKKSKIAEITDSYEPNMTDPRVLKRCIFALMSYKKLFEKSGSIHSTVQIHSKTIARYSSNYGTQLGLYLRRKLLVCVDNSYTPGSPHFKAYRLNFPGILELKEKLAPYIKESTPSDSKSLSHLKLQVQVAYYSKKCKSEIIDLYNGNARYRNLGYRSYNPLQNIPKEVRSAIFAKHGFDHAYDIETSCQTLMVQFAINHGCTKPLDGIIAYIKNKVAIRNQLATELGLSVKQVKEIITSITCGAKVGSNVCYHVLAQKYGSYVMEKCKKNEFIQAYKKDVSYIAKTVASTLPRKRNDKGRLIRITSSQKWSVYFYLEKLVRDCVADYCLMNSIKLILEHDGWTLNRFVEPSILEDVISTHTGYLVSLDYKKLSSEESLSTFLQEQSESIYPAATPTPMFITSLTDLIDVTVDVVKSAVKSGFNRLMNVLRVQTEVQRLSFAT